MKLNKNNYFARFYHWIHGSLPKDLCSYFWGWVATIIFLPFLLPGRMVTNQDTGSKVGVSITFWLLIFYSEWAGIKLFSLLFGTGLIFWYDAIIALVLGVFAIGTVVGFVALIIWFCYLYGESRIADNVSDVVGAVKGKYCTKINWK